MCIRHREEINPDLFMQALISPLMELNSLILFICFLDELLCSPGVMRIYSHSFSGSHIKRE